MKDTFASYHPFINFLFFLSVILLSMSYVHPLAQMISFLCAGLYYIQITERKGFSFLLKTCLPAVLITAFINPAFNHEGTTILLYLRNGNPLTLESILYGFSAGIMMITILLWFSSFSCVMTSDKFIYLFGKIIPALSLVLSMSFRFIPRFRQQLKTITESQKMFGKDVSEGSVWKRIKIAVSIFSILLTWSLENAIETADSMKSRGYGLKGRTAFTIYRFEERDKVITIWFVFCILFLVAGSILSAFGFRYFPNIRYAAIDQTTIPFYFIYLSLCITPYVINLMEERKWKTLYSKI